jgi:hypothetical protein
MAKFQYIIWVLIGLLVAGVCATVIEGGMVIFLGISTGNATIDLLIPLILIMALVGLMINQVRSAKMD